MFTARRKHGSPHGSRGNAIPATLTFFLGLALGAVAVAAGGGGGSLGALGMGGGSGGSVAAVEATRLQADIYRLAMSVDDAAKGNFDAFDNIEALRREISRRIGTLKNGDESLGIRKAGELQLDQLDRVERGWRSIDDSVQRLLSRQDLILELADSANMFNGMVPQMQSRLDEVARHLMESDASAKQQYILMRSMLLVDRLARGLSEILAGGDRAIVSTDRFARDAAMLGRSLEGQLNGNEELGMIRIENEKARIPLGEAFSIFSELEDFFDSMLTASTDLFEAQEAAHGIRFESEQFASDALALAQSY